MGKIREFKGSERSTYCTDASFSLDSFLASQGNLRGLSKAIPPSRVYIDGLLLKIASPANEPMVDLGAKFPFPAGPKLA